MCLMFFQFIYFIFYMLLNEISWHQSFDCKPKWNKYNTYFTLQCSVNTNVPEVLTFGRVYFASFSSLIITSMIYSAIISSITIMNFPNEKLLSWFSYFMQKPMTNQILSVYDLMGTYNWFTIMFYYLLLFHVVNV